MNTQIQSEIIKFLKNKVVLLSQNDGSILTIKLGYIKADNNIEILTSTSIKI